MSFVKNNYGICDVLINNMPINKFICLTTVCALWGVPVGVDWGMVWQRHGGGDGCSVFNAGGDN